MPIDVLFLGGTSIDLIQASRGDRYHPTFTASTGGSITNSAVIASKLGLKVALFSRIGKDPLGDFAIRFLNSCRVNTKGIIQDPKIRTPLAIANIDRRGNSIYAFYKNTPRDSIVPIEKAPRNILNNCKIFHFGSSLSYQKYSFEETLKYVKFLKKRGSYISFDPNIRPYAIKDKTRAKNRVLRLLKWVDLARLSEIDLRFLTGQKDLIRGLKMLKNRLKCEVVLTLGAKGSVYLQESLRGAKRRSNPIKVPAFKVKIADTIGAGDAFTAGFLYKIAQIGERQVFNNIRPHLAFASAVSALICTRPGSSQGLKDIKQANSFLAKHSPNSPLKLY